MQEKRIGINTRAFSSVQEKHVADTLDGSVMPGSGSGKFLKSDVSVKEASLSIECKTCITDKESFSIKQDWFKKHKDEAWSNRLSNTAIAFNYGPSSKENYYIINEKLMKFLVEKLKEYNE